jgi:REP element-mobilizing transposase RayT
MTAIRKFDGHRYELAAYVVMDDHVHALLAPLAPYELQGILHSWKSFTAHQMQHGHKPFGRVWQDEYFDRIIRDDHEFAQKAEYIVGNPRKRWPQVQEYPWVWPPEL